ncbi:MAG TPA: alpha/beta fold hydrolase [Thiolapillus brandeum]|uniref:Alpha/beta fold hydrolase n=1 Tax=Thiolapillus brandeum TaxID=1076588 RepID=A0A7C5IZ19_9GAMM|nr:alpha/beta fold hydrolase [Thiolapillus brandeum]
MEYLPPLVVDPPGEVRHSIVWLHGLGADGSDFLPVADALRLPPELGVRFVLPHAPRMPVTVNGGLVMPAWYDIHSQEPGAPVDLEGIRRSAVYVQSLVRQEHERGVEPGRVVLAGFSQGGLVVLAAALDSPDPLAGVMALSTYLPQAVMPEEALPRSIFQAHGRLDDVVPFDSGLAACERLRAQGHEVEWHEYDMAHSVCAEEVADIREWLLRRWGSPGDS